MKLPLWPRWVAPVLVAALVLLTVWAGYNFLHEATAASTTTAGPSWRYQGVGEFGYVAHLKPNTLFNTTNVTDTNLTLFVSITKTINVTFTDSDAVAPSASLGLHDNFTVLVYTSSWSKTLLHATQENSSANTSGVLAVDRYSLNVTAVEGVVSSIDTELNLSESQFTVRLSSVVTGGVAADGAATSLGYSSWLNLTFRGAEIMPAGAPGIVNNALTGAGSADPRGPAVAFAGAELAAAGAALTVGLWYLREDRRRWATAGLPDLDHLIEPFEEVIARTARPPQGATVIPVDAWDDLVKVADTLGRPILWPLGGPDEPRGSDFYVSDGAVAYLYHYPEAAGETAAPTAAAAIARGTPAVGAVPPPPMAAASSNAPVTPASAAPTAPPTARPPPRVVPTPVPPPPDRPDRLPPALARELAEEIKFQLGRTRDVRLDSAQRWYIYSLFTRAARKITQPDPEEARRAVAELRRTIDRAVDEAQRAS